jgi:putative transposase
MSKRLVGYDYSQPGFYFVTICTQQHRLVFGTIVDGQVHFYFGVDTDIIWAVVEHDLPTLKASVYALLTGQEGTSNT